MAMQETLAPPALAQPKWTGKRIAGWLLCGLWALLGTYLVWSMLSGMNQEMMAKYLPRMLQGLLVTLQLVGLSIVIGGALAIPVALARLSDNIVLRAVSFGYVYFFRGTPLLAQVFLLYYGAGQLRPALEAWNLWWFFAEAFNCVVLTFTLNTAAYQAEILRNAIQSVPRGQREAAQSLGLPGIITFWKIVMPQALITALRPLGNEIILMIKSSAIASVVTIFDLMGATKFAFSRTFDFDMYMWAAIIYLAMVELLRNLWERIERHLTRHLRRDAR